jgi:hypothetical protein
MSHGLGHLTGSQLQAAIEQAKRAEEEFENRLAAGQLDDEEWAYREDILRDLGVEVQFLEAEQEERSERADWARSR